MPQDKFAGRKGGQIALLRVAHGAVLAAVFICAGIICAGTAARAGDDDDSMRSSASIYDSMLQVIGLQRGADIQYSERSPLVVPPTRDLPPPVAEGPPPVPDWPKDPDIARRAKAKEKEKVRPHEDYVLDSSRPLRPGELNVPGTRPGGGSGSTGASADATPNPPKKSIFSMFSFGNKEEYATFTGEPSRTSLTDPPPGYLTPSPDQPYGLSPEHKQYKVPTVADRATPSSGSAGGN